MKTKLLKKLRRRALQRIKFVELSTYIIIAEVILWKTRRRYASYTFNEVNTYSVEMLEYELRCARMRYMLDIFEEIKNSTQTKSRKEKIKQVNHIK